MSPWVVVISLPLMVALAGAGYQRLATARERRRHPPPGALYDVGGFRMHLEAMGEGSPTVVLDSALAATSLSWAEIQPKIAAFTRVCSYDRAGFGWSEPAPLERAAEHMVDELHRLLKASGLEPPYVLVGHSYGGWIARLFASTHPQETAGLVLVDVPHPREWDRPTEAQRKRIERGATLARRGALLARVGGMRLVLSLRSSLGPITGARRGERERVSALLGRVPPSLRARLRSFWVQPKALEALASQIRNVPASAARLASETCSLGDRPLAVITAARPSPDRLRDQEEVARLSRIHRHVVAEASGHWIPLEAPELVVEAVRWAVNSHRRAHPTELSQ